MAQPRAEGLDFGQLRLAGELYMPDCGAAVALLSAPITIFGALTALTGKKTMTDVTDQTTNGADDGPQVRLLAQYVKDLSFENPNAPAVYSWTVQPQIDIQFNISNQKAADDVFEVALRITAKATTENGTNFAAELVYAGLFGLLNIPEQQLQAFLLAEAPRLLFPFARRVLADAVQDGGFPPLLLDPIDFGALYMQQQAQAEAIATAEPAGNA